MSYYNNCLFFFFFFLRLPRTHASVGRHMGSVLQVPDPPLGTASDTRGMLSWCSAGRGRRRRQRRRETTYPMVFPHELLAAWGKKMFRKRKTEKRMKSGLGWSHDTTNQSRNTIHRLFVVVKLPGSQINMGSSVRGLTTCFYSNLR